MTTNSEIQESFYSTLYYAALGYPMAWYGVDFVPPASGAWLEPRLMPNSDVAPGYAEGSAVLKRGIFSVTVYARAGTGTAAIDSATNAVEATFPRGTSIAGTVRVTNVYSGSADVYADKIYRTVTIEYAGH